MTPSAAMVLYATWVASHPSAIDTGCGCEGRTQHPADLQYRESSDLLGGQHRRDRSWGIGLGHADTATSPPQKLRVERVPPTVQVAAVQVRWRMTLAR